MISLALVYNMTERTRSKVDLNVFGDVNEEFQTGRALKKGSSFIYFYD